MNVVVSVLQGWSLGSRQAGLVLAAFPLVVEGLVRYVNGVRTIHKFLKFKERLAAWLEDLRCRKGIFRNKLLRLFVGAELADSEDLEAMIRDPKSALWRDPRREAAFNSYLGSEYGVFMSTVQRIHSAIERMGKKLRLDPAKVWSLSPLHGQSES